MDGVISSRRYKNTLWGHHVVIREHAMGRGSGGPQQQGQGPWKRVQSLSSWQAEDMLWGVIGIPGETERVRWTTLK